MTSLNSKIQLAVLNRKKSRNLLAKGFTLVELMIVIVIVGILSSVALPNFLNQTKKARATEAVSSMSAAFKNAQQIYLEDPSAFTNTVNPTGTTSCSTELGMNISSNIESTTCSVASDILTITAKTPDGTVTGKIDVKNGAVTKPVFN